MLKRILLILMLGVSLGAFAIRANRRPVTVVQPDGSTITVRLHGDENRHWLTGPDGKVLRRDADGFLRVDTTGNNPRSVRGSGDPRSISVRGSGDPRSISVAGRETRAPQVKAKGAQGLRHYPVILVNYADCKFRHKASEFDTWLNQEGYSVRGATGSVRDYWRDNSNGQFIPDFVVFGPYTLAHEQAYYAGNDENGNDRDPYSMISEAVAMAKADRPEVDFSEFDGDGDGLMDNCYVIYAGYSEASTANDDDMWPHSSHLTDKTTTVVDGIAVYNYSCSAELVGMPGMPAIPTMDGIGTFAHEFGHVLGLADMYDTDSYSGGLGLDPGDYSMYASGSYNNDSRTPPCLMAFERMQLGWAVAGQDIVPLSAPEDAELAPLAGNTARYIDCHPTDSGEEWYIVENRQQTGWDSYIPAHGLLITHYDHTASMQQWWDANGPNNVASHRAMHIVPADGLDDANTRDGDTWPGLNAATEFSGYRSWAGEAIDIPLTNITELPGGNVRFQVCGGTSQWDAVHTLVPQDIRDTSAVFRADIATEKEIVEAGFECGGKQYIADIAPAQQSAKHITPNSSLITPNFKVEDLQPATRYEVRAWARLADGTTVYGSPVPFSTECLSGGAPFEENFDSWTGGKPDCWQIIDRNGDGTTWTFDDTTAGMIYSYDNWNDADDWLICRHRIAVPQDGALYFLRGVTDASTMESLDVYVSTRSSALADFSLVERYSFGDYYNEQHLEECDLAQYAGKEIYIAFRCSSEKLQGDLWLWQMMVRRKLATPTITNFAQNAQDVLSAEWTPIDGAESYYLYFGRETDEPNAIAEFVPVSMMVEAQGDVGLSTGSIDFRSTGCVELSDIAEGIDDCKFAITTSGPFGVSYLQVEGSRDGQTWTSVGPRIELKEYDADGQAVEMEPYLQGKRYRRLRFRFTHGGRNARIRYLTLFYNDGRKIETLAEGATKATTMDINAKTAGEFDNGTYVLAVAAGDGTLYYDDSPYARYNKATTGIRVAGNVRVPNASKQYRLDGIRSDGKGIVVEKGKKTIAR